MTDNELLGNGLNMLNGAVGCFTGVFLLKSSFITFQVACILAINIKGGFTIHGSTGNDEEAEEIEELIKEEERKSHPTQVLICPVCNSLNVTYYMGGELGYQYRCKDCGYVGALVLEK